MNKDYSIGELAPHPYDIDVHFERISDKVYEGDTVYYDNEEVSNHSLVQSLYDEDPVKAHEYISNVLYGKEVSEELLDWRDKVFDETIEKICKMYYYNLDI